MPKTPKKAKAAKPVAPKTRKVLLTQEDLDINPDLIAQGYKLGDEVEVEDEASPEEDTAAVAEANAEIEEVDADEVGDSVDILEGKRYVRNYSKKVHGKDFLDLAKEFCAKGTNRRMVNPETVKAVIVSYRALDKKVGTSFQTTRKFTAAADSTPNASFKDKAVQFAKEMQGEASV